MRRVGAAGSVIAAVWLAAIAGPGAVSTVFAHAGLERSVPAASAVLDDGPDEILLDFDEPVEAAGAEIDLFDADGAAIALGAAQLASDDDSILTAAVPEIGDGTYAVVWRIVSEDGHVISGAFGFQVGTAAAADLDDLLDRVSADAGDRAVSRTYGAARAVAYLGAALLLGGGLLLLVVQRVDDTRRRPLLLVRIGAALAVLGTVVAFCAYSATIAGAGLGSVFDPDAWSTAIDTRTGHMMIVRLVAIAILAALTLAWRAAVASWWIATAAFAAVVAVASFPASGHLGATTPTALWVGLGALHVGCGLVWVGGLLMMASCRLADGAARFSRISSIAIPIVVVTGVIESLELVDDIDDLTATTWGRVLLIKIAVVVVALSVAGVSRWLVVHARGATLQRTVVTEAVLGLGVLGLAAGLVALPPTSKAESRVFSASVAEAGLLASVTVTPGRVGSNELHAVITPPGASIVPVESITARMLLPSRDIPVLPVTQTLVGANHLTGAITLPFSGEWTLELVVEVTPGNTILVKTTVPIP